ncbi:hypothetical protein NEAUS04_2617, partial [Nematocida ausubeli]
EDSEGNEMPKETVDHYNALINMFPSPSGEVSIYPKKGCKDSFTSFLKSKHVEEYAHRILAILLIRAEGVPVPLIIENEESACPKLVYTNEQKPEQSFNIPIDIASAKWKGRRNPDKGKEANIKKVNSRLLQTIKYFINAQIINPELKKRKRKSVLLPESGKKENYWEKEFTKTPAWLIQSYIYYYLETKEEAIKLYDEIDKILKFCMTNFGQKVKNTILMKLFNKYITCNNSLSDDFKWWKKVKEIENMAEAKKEIQLLPFMNRSQHPTQTMVEVNAHGNARSEAETISNGMESVLLSLLCCFAYDIETKTYNVDRIPGLLKEAKNLFWMQSKNMSASGNLSKMCGNPIISSPLSNVTPIIWVGQKIPQEVQEKWSEIIQNVVKGDKEISFITIDNRRMIKNDILNILIIILKVTGTYRNDYKEKIQKYRDSMSNGKIAGHSTSMQILSRQIIYYVAGVFSKMSREFLKKKTSSKDKKKIYLNFNICYNITVARNTLCWGGSIMIYYTTEDKAELKYNYCVKPEKVDLGIGLYSVKSNNFIINKFREEICMMPKDSYTMYTLSKYADSLLKPCISDDLVVGQSDITRRKLLVFLCPM